MYTYAIGESDTRYAYIYIYRKNEFVNEIVTEKTASGTNRRRGNEKMDLVEDVDTGDVEKEGWGAE